MIEGMYLLAVSQVINRSMSTIFLPQPLMVNVSH